MRFFCSQTNLRYFLRRSLRKIPFGYSNNIIQKAKKGMVVVITENEEISYANQNRVMNRRNEVSNLSQILLLSNIIFLSNNESASSNASGLLKYRRIWQQWFKIDKCEFEYIQYAFLLVNYKYFSVFISVNWWMIEGCSLGIPISSHW